MGMRILSPETLIAPNFRWHELVRSEAASRLGLNNEPGEFETENLISVVGHIAQPVRSHFELPVVITSGYRSPAVNSAIGGYQESQHVEGEALDFHVVGVDHFTVARWIAESLSFDQLILEYVDETGLEGWIHCSYRRTGRNRREVRLARRTITGKTVYPVILREDIPYAKDGR